MAGGTNGILSPRWRALLDGPLFSCFGFYNNDGSRGERSEVVSKLAKTGRYDALIALGVVVEGETPHAQMIGDSTGIALLDIAREYGLPRSLQQFIDSHHGTTLVEYFYHAAKTEAEADEKASVDEVEFRYPGPRPRSKEAAILMLADCVESATRAMSEPNPGRIENLVRVLSQKRLLDGQSNECDLTFRELGLIEDAIIARVCAIHHGRIAYPTARSEESVAELA